MVQTPFTKMKMNLYLVVAIVIYLSKASHQGPTENQIIACGQYLAIRRAEVCYDDMTKRSPMNPQIESESFNKIEDFSWPLMDRHSAIQWYRNKRSGLVDECCFKPCTIDEIRSYC